MFFVVLKNVIKNNLNKIGYSDIQLLFELILIGKFIITQLILLLKIILSTKNRSYFLEVENLTNDLLMKENKNK